MSPQTSRLLWFFLEGGQKPYSIDNISISANVDQLKARIQQRVKILHDIDPDDLRLWKVVSLKFQGRAPSDFLFQLNVIVPIDPDDSLVRRLDVLGNIDTYSRKLSSGEKVMVLFPEPHSDVNLHIIVQCPREYRWLIVPYEQN
jgi:Crinkler effector protein N-terminal domain